MKISDLISELTLLMGDVGDIEVSVLDGEGLPEAIQLLVLAEEEGIEKELLLIDAETLQLFLDGEMEDEEDDKGLLQ